MDLNYIEFVTKTSFEDFKRNKVRTFLTSLGILIGVLAVVLLMAFGFGLKKYIEDQFNSLGKNLIMVMPGSGFAGGGQGLIGGVHFDDRDLSKIKRVNGVEATAPIFMKSVKIEASGKSEKGNLMGTSEDAFKVIKLELDAGHLFTNADLEKKAKVIILGSSAAEKLFGSSQNAIGKKVKIQNQRFVIIGVMKKIGGSLGSDDNGNLYTPYTSVYSMNPDKKFFAIYLKAKDNADVAQVKADVKKALLKRYKEDDFSVTEQSELLSTVNSIFGIMNTVLIAIGSISLLVGGIGIMNIMYATVTDRTKEIGVRRAIGATKQDILFQFVFESTILSLLGGLLGLAISTLIVIAIQPVFPAVINALSVTVGFGISSIIGIFFGVFPARRAANLSPIEAIRYE